MTGFEVPLLHPRAESLKIRHKLVSGFHEGLVAEAGLLAHGRGEAFDYLLGEKTRPFAESATAAAASALLLARRPVISVNGNTAALCAVELVRLAELVGAKLEVNLFYWSASREKKIVSKLLEAGAKGVLTPHGEAARIYLISSNRARVHAEGIGSADVVFVPLEDGDRTQALTNLGKTVIAIDLNPLSRTAQTATITIVDNLVRVLPNMLRAIGELAGRSRETLRRLFESYDNRKTLQEAVKYINVRLASLAGSSLRRP